MPGGQPTKYNKGMLEASDAYIDDYETHGHVIPSVIGLAVVLDVVSKTLYNWGDDNPEFLRILGKIKERQEMVLLSKGLTSDFNSNICKLALGKHGYHEKIDQQSTMNVNISHEDADTL